MKWPYVRRASFEVLERMLLREEATTARLREQMIDLVGRSGLLPKKIDGPWEAFLGSGLAQNEQCRAGMHLMGSSPTCLKCGAPLNPARSVVEHDHLGDPNG